MLPKSTGNPHLPRGKQSKNKVHLSDIGCRAFSCTSYNFGSRTGQKSPELTPACISQKGLFHRCVNTNVRFRACCRHDDGERFEVLAWKGSEFFFFFLMGWSWLSNIDLSARGVECTCIRLVARNIHPDRGGGWMCLMSRCIFSSYCRRRDGFVVWVWKDSEFFFF